MALTPADRTWHHDGYCRGEPLKYADIKAADIVISQLIGIAIYNKQNDTIGEALDVVISDGKSVVGIIESVGGFRPRRKLRCF